MSQIATKVDATIHAGLLAVAMLGASLALPLAPLHARQGSSLPVAEAQGFLGTWTLEMDFQGNAVQMTLALADSGGMLAATLTSPRQPEPRSIFDIRRAGDALHLSWSQDFQGQAITLEMKLQRTDQGLAGTFGDTNGLFSTDITASVPGGAPAAPAAAGAGGRTGGRGQGGGEGGQRGRGGAGGVAALSLQGKEIKISYPKLAAASADFAALDALDAGGVFSYVGGGAVKLMSAGDLVFGETGAGERVAKAGNVAPSYPGVYSVWLEKGEAGTWSLVFNEQADIWGTQREAAADVLQVPLSYSAAPAPADRLELALEPAGENGGVLRITWGPHRWEAPFQVR